MGKVCFSPRRSWARLPGALSLPPPSGGEARVPGFSLQTRGACQAPCQTSGACGAGLGTGGASPRAPARCAAATQRHSRGGSDAMAGSESPREGPGSAARSGRTPAGLAAAGAEGGGGTRPQAPPRPAPPRPSFFARSDVCEPPLRVAPPRCVRLRLRLRNGLRPRSPAGSPSLHPPPFSTLGPQLPVGSASWNRAWSYPNLHASGGQKPSLESNFNPVALGHRSGWKSQISPLRRSAGSPAPRPPSTPPAWGRPESAPLPPRRTEEARPGGGGMCVYWGTSRPRGHGQRSQRRHAVGARVPRQTQRELAAHVVGHEPASHEVVAPGEAASAALGRTQ